jgi:hypothetical protein
MSLDSSSNSNIIMGIVVKNFFSMDEENALLAGNSKDEVTLASPGTVRG